MCYLSNMRELLDLAMFIFTTVVMPVVINKYTESGRFNWLKRYPRFLWTVIFVIYSLYLLHTPVIWGIAMEWHQRFAASPSFGYIICAVIGASLLCGYWWLTGQMVSEPPKAKIHNDYSILEYGIASVLPNKPFLDFLESGKVWFYIRNHEPRKLRAYIKITFISKPEIYIEAKGQPFYDGNKPIELNPLKGWDAPGIVVPDELKEKAKEHKSVQIRMDCVVKDSNDKFIVEMLPIIYTYSNERNNWYPELGSS